MYTKSKLNLNWQIYGIVRQQTLILISAVVYQNNIKQIYLRICIQLLLRVYVKQITFCLFLLHIVHRSIRQEKQKPSLHQYLYVFFPSVFKKYKNPHLQTHGEIICLEKEFTIMDLDNPALRLTKKILLAAYLKNETTNQ